MVGSVSRKFEMRVNPFKATQTAKFPFSMNFFKMMPFFVTTRKLAKTRVTLFEIVAIKKGAGIPFLFVIVESDEKTMIRAMRPLVTKSPAQTSHNFSTDGAQVASSFMYVLDVLLC